MKKQKRERHFIRKLTMAAPFIVASNISISSSFSECYLTVYVAELGSQGSQVSDSDIMGLNIRVISINEKDSYLCPFFVGQEIKIGKPERTDNLLTAIQPGDTLIMQYGMYSGMGENGVAVSGEQWSILEMINVQEEQKSETSDTTSEN